MTWHEKLQRKVKARVPLSLMDVPSFLLRRYVGYERRAGESARAALLRVAHRLADDPEWYEIRMRMKNPAVSTRQQRFMCAEYGRLKHGRRSRSGINKAAAKEFCMARKRRQNPKEISFASSLVQERAGVSHRFKEWARHDEGMDFIRWLRWRHPDDYKKMVITARKMRNVGPSGRKKSPDIQFGSSLTLKKAGIDHLFKKWARYDENMDFHAWLKWRHPSAYQKLVKATHAIRRERYKKNPHLTSGKWKFVGMFAKADIASVRRILKIHGIKNKVTKDHVKGEKGMRELYVERAAWRTAYEAITRLFETGRAA